MNKIFKFSIIAVLILFVLININLSAQNSPIITGILGWQYSNTNETGFTIQRATGTTNTWVTLGTVPSTQLTYTDTNNLQYSTTYFYEVNAFNATQTSLWSNMATNTTAAALPAPINLQIQSTVY